MMQRAAVAVLLSAVSCGSACMCARTSDVSGTRRCASAARRAAVLLSGLEVDQRSAAWRAREPEMHRPAAAARACILAESGAGRGAAAAPRPLHAWLRAGRRARAALPLSKSVHHSQQRSDSRRRAASGGGEQGGEPLTSTPHTITLSAPRHSTLDSLQPCHAHSSLVELHSVRPATAARVPLRCDSSLQRLDARDVVHVPPHHADKGVEQHLDVGELAGGVSTTLMTTQGCMCCTLHSLCSRPRARRLPLPA